MIPDFETIMELSTDLYDLDFDGCNEQQSDPKEEFHNQCQNSYNNNNNGSCSNANFNLQIINNMDVNTTSNTTADSLNFRNIDFTDPNESNQLECLSEIDSAIQNFVDQKQFLPIYKTNIFNSYNEIPTTENTPFSEEHFRCIRSRNTTESSLSTDKSEQEGKVDEKIARRKKYKYNPKPLRDIQHTMRRNHKTRNVRTEDYNEQRKKNNEASRRSRLARRLKECIVLEEVKKLRKENAELRSQIKLLKSLEHRLS